MLGGTGPGVFGSRSQVFRRCGVDAACMDRTPQAPTTRHPARRSRIAAAAASAVATVAIAGHFALAGTPTRAASATGRTTAAQASTSASTSAATAATPATSANTSSGGS
jgi:hypothetical protein